MWCFFLFAIRPGGPVCIPEQALLWKRHGKGRRKGRRGTLGPMGLCLHGLRQTLCMFQNRSAPRPYFQDCGIPARDISVMDWLLTRFMKRLCWRRSSMVRRFMNMGMGALISTS